MPKDRKVIRVHPAADIKELLRRVLYSRPLLVERALRVLELIKSRHGCVDNDLIELANASYVRVEDLEYILRKLESVGMISRLQDKICLSDKFSRTLRELAELWERFLSSR